MEHTMDINEHFHRVQSLSQWRPPSTSFNRVEIHYSNWKKYKIIQISAQRQSDNDFNCVLVWVGVEGRQVIKLSPFGSGVCASLTSQPQDGSMKNKKLKAFCALYKSSLFQQIQDDY